MLQFILVDDEKIMRDKERQLLNEVLFSANVEYDILEYSHLTDELKTVINNSNPKVYIMDIDLNSKVSGLDIGKYIRNYDWDSEIIYITSHDKMFEKVFRNIYKVFDFIEKFDSMEDRFKNDINQILLRKWDKKKFTYSNNRISFEIYLDDILYLYRDTVERKVAIKTVKGNIFYVNKNINQIIEDLDERFIQVHRSCIVNKDKVNVYNWAKGYFVLDTGERVDMLSKTYKQ
mgnify:FL=1